MAEKWRNDGLNPRETATINAVSTKAVDRIESQSIFTLSIKHVAAFHGHGFMAAISHGKDVVANSDVVYGMYDNSYQLALRLGRIILGKEVERLEKEVG